MCKPLISCNMFEFLFGPWDMQLGLSFWFWVRFGICFGIAFESDFGKDSRLCNVCSMVGFCIFAWDMYLRLGLRMSFRLKVGFESHQWWWHKTAHNSCIQEFNVLCYIWALF